MLIEHVTMNRSILVVTLLTIGIVSIVSFLMSGIQIEGQSLDSKSDVNDSYGNRLGDPNLPPTTVSLIIIEEPVMKRAFLDFPSGGGIDFISYQDFPVKLDSKYLRSNDLRIIGNPSETWAKILTNSTSEQNGMVTLRIAGMVKPQVINNFNSTIYVVNARDNQILGISSIPVVKNGIVMEMAAIAEDTPIRFKNEITAYSNSAFPIMYGVVYDNARHVSYANVSDTDLKALDITIKPIGIIHNGKLDAMPEWLKIEMMRAQISVEENEPSYYGMLISMVNAPLGTYEIVLHESIDERVFTETLVITILEG